MKISLEMWCNLTTMADHYAANGYRDLAQPWIASQQAMEVTLPPENTPTVLHGTDLLLGSAEQAFIDRMIEGTMPVGPWQALTPCFRIEPKYDALTLPYFMKLELNNYQPLDPEGALKAMITLVLSGLKTLVGSREIQLLSTDIGTDLMLAGQEIGSYGIRTFQNHTWVYGTGLAEPRFTTLLRSGTIL